MTQRGLRMALAVVGALLLDIPGEAGVCLPPTVERENPYRYLLTLADVLSYAKSGLDRTGATGLGSKASDFDLLLGLKLGKGDFECARSQVAPFAASSN